MTTINGTSSADVIDVTGNVGTLNGGSAGGPITNIDSSGGYDNITVTNSTVTGTIDGGYGGMNLTVANSTVGVVEVASGTTSDFTFTDATIGAFNGTNTPINVNWTGGALTGNFDGGSGTQNVTLTDVTIANNVLFDANNAVNATYVFEGVTVGDNFQFTSGGGVNLTIEISGTTSFGSNADFDFSNNVNGVLILPDGTVVTIGGTDYVIGTDTLPTGDEDGSFVLPGGRGGGTFNNADLFQSSGPVCFTPGTMILTTAGKVPVEALNVGDLVINSGGDAVPIRWIGSREVAFDTVQHKNRPIQIKAGALGASTPTHDLAVSPQHCLLIRGPIVAQLFGTHQVFVRARWMTEWQKVRIMQGKKRTRYITFLFDRHEIIQANGAWTESFYPGRTGLEMLPARQRCEIEDAFPRLRENPDSGYGPRAARVLTRAETDQLRANSASIAPQREPNPLSPEKMLMFRNFEKTEPRKVH